MNNTATIEKMSQLRLLGMKTAFELTMETGQNHEYTPDQMIAHLIESEYNYRHTRRIGHLIKTARFRYQAAVEEINFATSRNIDKNNPLRLAEGNYIQRKHYYYRRHRSGQKLSCHSPGAPGMHTSL